MPAPVLFADGEAIGGSIAFCVLCISLAVYYCVVEWRKARVAQIEAELKREMVHKGLPADEIERVLKAAAPPRE
jgi:hypothetical protein